MSNTYRFEIRNGLEVERINHVTEVETSHEALLDVMRMSDLISDVEKPEDIGVSVISSLDNLTRDFRFSWDHSGEEFKPYEVDECEWCARGPLEVGEVVPVATHSVDDPEITDAQRLCHDCYALAVMDEHVPDWSHFSYSAGGLRSC